MNSVKCGNCGLVGWSNVEVCKGCGAPLADASAGASEAQPRPREHDATGDLSFAREVPTGSKTGRVVLLAVLLIALCGGAWLLYSRRSGSQGSATEAAMRREFAAPPFDERVRDTMLAYLAQPGFAGTKVSEQVLGPARLELLQVSDREVYFSAPTQAQGGPPFEQVIGRFVVDPKRVVTATEDGGQLRLGKYSLPQSAGRSFFKTPVDNVRFDPATVLEFPYERATYRLDMRQLNDFLMNRSVFGGPLRAESGRRKGDLPVVFANHGAFVARPEEPSLRRFTQELTRDLPGDEAARESRVQRVLDFVSREIIYDQREATSNVELLKRPNEVLMSGQSDCSNKAILLGSLLGQLGEDYLFLYTPDHITVAVRRGRFPDLNGLALEWEGQTWMVAESTVPGFRIGVDRLKDEARFKRFQHVQRPRERDVIFDLSTGGRIPFR